MAAEPIDDIEAWSKKLSAWRQDCLRRLSTSSDLTEADLGDLLAMIKHSAGFSLDTPPPTPLPFETAHFGGGDRQPIVLKGIANVANVNRLVTNASLTFCPKALTIVYGRNGSGKSGFVRIMRTACRTRIENPSKLKVLADVYGGSSGLPSAEILVDAGGGDKPITWTPGMSAAPELLQVAVFDTLSAQLYVDGGNQIRYLPFGLALPHRLNAVCLTLKERLESERSTVVGNKLSLTTIAFPTRRSTNAQAFAEALKHYTTDAEIDEATQFEAEDKARLDMITSVLSAGAAAAADLAALATWVETIQRECEVAASDLSDSALAELTALKSKAVAARQAADLVADAKFADEPLPGVGSDSWRMLWAAARDFSIGDAYAGQPFPVTVADDGDAACVLCQQPLLPDGAARMARFQEYMDGAIGLALIASEQAVSDAVNGITDLAHMQAADFPDRLEQLRRRDSKLADSLLEFRASAIARRADALRRLAGKESQPVPSLASPHTEMTGFATKLRNDKDALANADDAQERARLVAEMAELDDRQFLASNRARLLTRRDLLELDNSYSKALAEVHTKGITQKANELLDTHLTSRVVARFNAERERFDIMHLKVGLSRKSGQTMAEFEVDVQTKLTKVTSDILSEGEQRALALAGFLTEVAMTDGSGPIVVDDPVSSLDRDRSTRVAERLAEEACRRQVVVFTHDIVFFNELCRAADERGIEPVTVALFGDKNAAGKVDAAGMLWKGLNVTKRIGRIKNDVAPLTKLHATSPADYEYQVKNLYGRLRDTYERVVEEVIFRDIVRRGTDVIQTQLLRFVTLSDALAVRFHAGMTRANTYSHDNPASGTVAVPAPDEFLADIAELEHLVEDLRAQSIAAEAARPQMKPAK